MTKTFENIVSNFQDPQPEWTVTINGKDYSKNLELLEFTQSINNPLKVTVKLEGIDSSDNIPQDAEIIVGRRSGELFRGVLKEVNPNMLNTYTFKGTGYAGELESDSKQILSDEGVGDKFSSTDIQTVVDTLVDGSTLPNSRTFSTSFSGNVSSTVVDDFRVKKTQIEDVNRLMGEYDTEWYVTKDGSNNPVFNITDQISFTDSNGNPLDTITTYGTNQSAEMVEQNVNRNKGDFDGVLVRGYGDGEEQITATSGSTGKGNRVLIYTDKTILTHSQAQNRADNLANTQTVDWQEIEVKPSNPNKIYGIGDELKIEAEDARLNDSYRVVKSYFKIWPGEDQFESKLNLSNKPQTFIDDFKENKNQTDSETDYSQGAQNRYADKESEIANESNPINLEVYVPDDVKDDAGNNRFKSATLHYTLKDYKDYTGTTGLDAGKAPSRTGVTGSLDDGGGGEIDEDAAKEVEQVQLDSSGWTNVTGTTNNDPIQDCQSASTHLTLISEAAPIGENLFYQIQVRMVKDGTVILPDDNASFPQFTAAHFEDNLAVTGSLGLFYDGPVKDAEDIWLEARLVDSVDFESSMSIDYTFISTYHFHEEHSHTDGYGTSDGEHSDATTDEIVDVDTTNDWFTVKGDQTDDYLSIDPDKDEFTVVKSTGNDGEYTLNQRESLNNGNTKLYVDENVSDDTADGAIIPEQAHGVTGDTDVSVSSNTSQATDVKIEINGTDRTGDIHGSVSSGTDEAQELDISDYINKTGWNTINIYPQNGTAYCIGNVNIDYYKQK